MSIIASKYRLMDYIGEGQFGSVCEAVCIKTQKKYAVKMEKEMIQFSSIKHEATMLHYLNSQKCVNIPSIYYFGMCISHLCLVLTHYECSLDNMRENLSTLDIIEWWNSSLNALEKIHHTGIVHRDIKPQHFMKNDKQEWNLIDFGLSTTYLIDQKHISEKHKESIVGSPNYVSLYVHEGRDPVRRDDVISLIYILWELLYGTFIFEEYDARRESSELHIAHIDNPYNMWLYKQKQWGRLYGILNYKNDHDSMTELLISVLTHVERLRFTDKPNYSSYYVPYNP
jgi:casein kinase 1